MIGDNSSIEDNCVIHARPDEQTTIGDWVTVGHGAIIHNATVRDYVIVGMGSIVSDWAEVGRWAVIGEGAVVRQRQEIPADAIAVGTPARLLEKQVAPNSKRNGQSSKNSTSTWPGGIRTASNKPSAITCTGLGVRDGH